MSTAPKIAQRTQHTGTFAGDQVQRLAQDVARKSNSHDQMLAALQNRAYVALAADTTTASATYGTLLTANITTVLSSGYLIVTFSAAMTHITNAGTTEFKVVVDGAAVKGCMVSLPAGYAASVGIVVRVAVTRGAHVVLVQWKTDTATARINASTRVEEHAHLLVQEAA